MNNKMSAYYDRWQKMSKDLESEKATNSQLKAQITKMENEQKEAANKAKNGSGSGSGSGGSVKGASKGNNSGYSDEDAAWGIAQNI